MEQNLDASTPKVPVAENNKQNGGNGLKIATVIACVVAACGIGFGVYGMIQSSQKDSQISDLKVQVEDSNGKITALETEKIETTDENGTTVTITDTAKITGGPYIENDYFYVPEWGVKYKLSDELTGYGFAVDQESIWHGGKSDRYNIALSATRKADLPDGGQAQSTDDIFTCSMILVSRSPVEEYPDSMRATMPSTTFIDFGNYVFRLFNETGFIGSCGVNREAAKTAAEIIMSDILSRPEAI